MFRQLFSSLSHIALAFRRATGYLAIKRNIEIMFIRTANEILSVMPTSRWSRPEDLLPYLEEEERGALEPLLGGTLYQWLCTEYERLREESVDITAANVKPTGKAKEDPQRPHVSVTERLEKINAGMPVSPCPCAPTE